MEKIEHKISNILEWFTEICFIFMFFSTSYQIIARSVFGLSCTWTDEFSRFMYVWITFVGAIITTLNSEHIRVEVLYDRISPKMRAWLDVFGNLIAIIFCIVAFRGGVALTRINYKAFFSALPRYLTYSLLYLPIPISMISISLVLGMRIIITIKNMFKKSKYKSLDLTKGDKDG